MKYKGVECKDKVCIVCGKTYQSYRDNQLYCSQECRQQGKRNREAEYYRDGHRKHPCPICGTLVANRTYCSQECIKKAKQIRKYRKLELEYSGEKPCDSCPETRCTSTCVQWEVWFIKKWDKLTAELRRKTGLNKT